MDKQSSNASIMDDTDTLCATVDQVAKPSSSSQRESESLQDDFEERTSASHSMLSIHSKISDTALDPEAFKRRKIELYAEDKGPTIYTIKGNVVTPPIITKNLPEAFTFLPIYGRPKTKADLEEFQNNKIREFVGCDLNDEEFEKLSKYCSPDNLKTGKELVMMSNVPLQGLMSSDVQQNLNIGSGEDRNQLCLLKKHKLRVEKDQGRHYEKRLKYRGTRLMPPSQEETNPYITIGVPLQPGKDILYRIRVYRPFYSSKELHKRTRHSLFCCDILILGRQKLTALRDRFVCANDVGMRVDLSDKPDDVSVTSAKELFPSGFLFINNVFYVDRREGCADRSAPVREWALRRGLGHFPHRDMGAVRLDELVLKLGHPEVYIHQGNCEHLFTFSEVRLLNATDPLMMSSYPCHTAVSQNQTVYCTTCAEFGAKWIVVGCPRVPFDPAFFCDTCFKLYLYKDGKKVGDFKAYLYRGNELNMLKPFG